MRNRYVLGLLLILLSASGQAFTVKSESPANVELSNRDVNRLVCHHGNINDVYYSEEKGISVSVNDSNAFVKFLIKNEGDRDTYINVESEFYVVCDGEIYTLIGTPKDIPAQTIHLSSPDKGKIEKNMTLYSALPIEEQAVDLIKRVLTDEIPDSFYVKKIEQADGNMTESVVKGVSFSKIREISIEGVGLRLTEYVGRAKFATDLNEVDFLETRIGKDILAVTVDPMQVRPGMVTRVYIVERVLG